MFRFLAILLFCCCLAGKEARSYSVIHYDQINGYPASYCYSIYQDSKGYVWISSENGLVRFNGYEFKLFTTKDGLPDNEVFAMSEDAYGRFWFSPFTNSVAYMKDGRVYNTSNTPELKKLVFKVWCEAIFADRYGNVMFQDKNSLLVMAPNGIIKREVHSAMTDTVRFAKDDSARIWMYSEGRKLVYDRDHFVDMGKFDFPHKSWQYWLGIRLINVLGFEKAMPFLEKVQRSKAPFFNDIEELDRVNVIFQVSPDIVALNRKDGCFLVDLATAEIVDTLLYGHNIGPSAVMKDGSLWIGTHGNGVFRFIRSSIQSLPIPNKQSSVMCMYGEGKDIYAMLEKGAVVHGTLGDNGEVRAVTEKIFKGRSLYAVYANLSRRSNGDWMAFAGYNTLHKRLDGKHERELNLGYTKSVVAEDSLHLLVGTAGGVFRVNTQRFDVEDTLYQSRVTSVAKAGNTIYAGLLNGLLATNSQGVLKPVFNDVPELNTHIVKLCQGHNNLVWVANNRADLVAVSGNTLVKIINSKNGLQCNRISAIMASDQFVWVGTDNGLYAVQHHAPYAVVRHLTFNMGLSSNQVSCLAVSGQRIFVGTTVGVSYFNENDVFTTRSDLNLVVNSVVNGDSLIPFRDHEVMRLHAKSLVIDFDIVDLEGGQKPMYQYCLNEDNNWIKLDNSSLNFAAAPYGRFSVSIRALSPNLANDTVKRLYFYRPFPLYLRWWFLVLASGVLAAGIGCGIILYLRRMRVKDEEKLSVQRNLLQLEQMALQGQMNPHFIFNCLAAIKQNYNGGRKEYANEFVDAFAALIRQTFEMGTETFVSLDKELRYLSRYLSVERERFDQSFNFTIEKSLSSSEMEIPVPAMLLQPIAENAVRHGVRHLPDGEGIIQIKVTQVGDRIEIVIEDNGPGRQQTQSRGLGRGMSVTSTTVNQKRIDILNRLFEQQIVLRTEDVMNDRQEVAGTRVFISYPLSVTDFLNQ